MKFAVYETGVFVPTSKAEVLQSQGAEQRTPSRRKIYRRMGKRAFDIVLSLAILPVIAPVIFVLWVIARMDGGPGFFAQPRVGRGGRHFKFWKIRTMVPNAEQKLVQYLAENPSAAAEWKEYQKLTNDPRITPVGKFLRATSLDELPQIWNVLRGDMSLVGPRPMLPSQVVEYGHHRHAYFAMVPGISGIWQVSSRNESTFVERARMDVDYLRSHSLALDVKIILKTALTVFNRSGR